MFCPRRKRSLTARMSIIEEHEVEVMPENIPNKVMHKNVDICLIKQYFTKDAWLIVEEVFTHENNANTQESLCTQ